MKGNEPTNRVRPLFEMGSELPPAPEVKQEIGNRKEEAKRVVKRLYAIFEDAFKMLCFFYYRIHIC